MNRSAMCEDCILMEVPADYLYEASGTMNEDQLDISFDTIKSARHQTYSRSMRPYHCPPLSPIVTEHTAGERSLAGIEACLSIHTITHPLICLEEAFGRLIKG